jgi:hypothetical protein
MTLRELRVWHWERAVGYRKAANKYDRDHEKHGSKYAQQQAKANHGRANFHIKAVQAMNDIPELQGSTAEQDCARRTQVR